jgi:hypothetical protein
VLLDHWDACVEARHQRPRPLGEFGDLVFLSPRGTPVHRRIIDAHLKAICGEAGVPPMSLYDLRRTLPGWPWRFLAANVSGAAEMMWHAGPHLITTLYGAILGSVREARAGPGGASCTV